MFVIIIDIFCVNTWALIEGTKQLSSDLGMYVCGTHITACVYFEFEMAFYS